jgi:hypothetical protein
MILSRGHAPLDVQVTFMLVAIAAGAIGDLLAIYLSVVVLRVGSGWTVPELTGMVTLCGVVGLLISFVAAPRRA